MTLIASEPYLIQLSSFWDSSMPFDKVFYCSTRNATFVVVIDVDWYQINTFFSSCAGHWTEFGDCKRDIFGLVGKELPGAKSTRHFQSSTDWWRYCICVRYHRKHFSGIAVIILDLISTILSISHKNEPTYGRMLLLIHLSYCMLTHNYHFF